VIEWKVDECITPPPDYFIVEYCTDGCCWSRLSGEIQGGVTSFVWSGAHGPTYFFRVFSYGTPPPPSPAGVKEEETREGVETKQADGGDVKKNIETRKSGTHVESGRKSSSKVEAVKRESHVDTGRKSTSQVEAGKGESHDTGSKSTTHTHAEADHSDKEADGGHGDSEGGGATTNGPIASLPSEIVTIMTKGLCL